jgi:UDP-galactopyranose mutase
MQRIPVRTHFNSRYFSDRHEAMPAHGYTHFISNLLDHPNIAIELNTDFFKVKTKFNQYEKLFFTGPIDRYFNNRYKKLHYRSLRFKFTTYNQEHYQENSVINYPSSQPAFTRIVEYKLLYGQKHPKTTVSREYSTWKGEPYYPVPSARNRAIFAKYQNEAKKNKRRGVFFVGRLANYKYFNMDQAIKNALDLFSELEHL